MGKSVTKKVAANLPSKQKNKHNPKQKDAAAGKTLVTAQSSVDVSSALVRGLTLIGCV
jgi:hypothetical protein